MIVIKLTLHYNRAGGVSTVLGRVASVNHAVNWLLQTDLMLMMLLRFVLLMVLALLLILFMLMMILYLLMQVLLLFIFVADTAVFASVISGTENDIDNATGATTYHG